MNLIAYDISSDKLREKTAKKLLEYGMYRVQKSVFIGDLSRASAGVVRTWLKKQITDEHDFVMMINQSLKQIKEATLLGAKPPNWQEIIDPPNTLIF